MPVLDCLRHGSSTVPAQQPTDQVTKQTVPAASTCKATVTEVNGNTMLVKPVDGSWELSSANQFSLSAYQPYDGSIKLSE